MLKECKYDDLPVVSSIDLINLKLKNLYRLANAWLVDTCKSNHLMIYVKLLLDHRLATVLAMRMLNTKCNRTNLIANF